jgi:hypothetical protein
MVQGFQLSVLPGMHKRKLSVGPEISTFQLKREVLFDNG